MKTPTLLGLAGALLLLAGLLTGCGTGGSTSAHGSASYGVVFYDPWYYNPNPGSFPPDGIAPPPPPPPPSRPAPPPKPEQPIAEPPAQRPSMPSIPSAPRPAPSGG